MSRHTVHGQVTVSCWTVVEADSEEEARRVAAERSLAGLCAHPFDAGEEEAWLLDTDGEPKIEEEAA